MYDQGVPNIFFKMSCYFIAYKLCYKTANEYVILLLINIYIYWYVTIIFLTDRNIKCNCVYYVGMKDEIYIRKF